MTEANVRLPLSMRRYAHASSGSTPRNFQEMRMLMAQDRAVAGGLLWAIVEALSPEQQAQVLEKFGWREVKPT